MHRKIVIFFSVFVCLSLRSQNIKTVQLKASNNSSSFSCAFKLGTKVVLTFDDLEADTKEYSYKIEHYTHDWKPSTLSVNQYIIGFDENPILDVTNSFNTLQPYTHYSVAFPNSNTRITKSGNYLISILDEDENTVFSRRIIFYEDTVVVGVSVSRSRTNLNDKEQIVQFIVNHPNLTINTPNQEVTAVLLQNHSWNNQIANIQPLYVKSNQLVYNHTTTTNFLGNNEFRNFDTKYVRNTSMNIERVERIDIYHTFLFADEPRRNRIYSYNPDINGQFTITTLDANDAATEADYTMVHFSLLAEPFSEDVYVYGAFNDFQMREENRMIYNNTSHRYEASILLKQGFYNYTYATESNSGTVNLNSIDGTYFQTENEYTAVIYYRPFGGLYDRVIGVGFGYYNQNR
ncbi:DUF5103 domain-containing protein [Tenacibaculum sp. SG-28]|uniref:type IX secretion system plug protein n=1 Tax=Tenacibaculum sp. SG-28 TaxID=754426 RepID=UPI000CF45724|nr:DUF5103 domain-containing protein [Tenacibaculum sp. SG-28]PQJ21191.1 DUF5103 domain-containing protein [Tenacibaculum sp. SG-28]